MVKPQKTLVTKGDSWVVSFGQRLERARGRVGLTQAALAGNDLSKSFVSLLETARSYPSVETLLLLARRAGSSLAGLLLDREDLRRDTALSLIALARDAVWTRPAWATDILRVVEVLLPDVPLWAKVDATVVRGLAATLKNRLVEAERLARAAQRDANRIGYLPGQAHALALRGDVALLRRKYDRAFQFLGDAVSRYRECGALRSEPGAKALLWLGTAAFRIGRSRFARRSYAKARAVAVRLHLRMLEGQALWGLGFIARAEGDLTKAAELFADARAAFEDSEDLVNLSEVLMNLSALYREQGKHDQALNVARRAVRICEQLGNLRRRSDAYQVMAAINLQLGDLDGAESAAQQALRDATAARDPRHRALSHWVIGRVAAARQDKTRARRYLRLATRQLKALGLRDQWAEAARDLALILQPGDQATEAMHYLTQAIHPQALPGAGTADGPAVRSRPRPRRPARKTG